MNIFGRGPTNIAMITPPLKDLDDGSVKKLYGQESRYIHGHKHENISS